MHTPKYNLALIFAAIGASLLNSNLASAQESSDRALWVSDHALSIDDRVLLKAGIERSTKLKLIRPIELKDKLQSLAEQVPEIDDKKYNAQLRRARQAYLDLKLSRADGAYTQALREVFAHPLSLPDIKRLARVYFEKAQISKAKRRNRQAIRELRIALTLNPNFKPSPDRFGPPVIRAAWSMKKKLRTAKKFQLQINRAPNDAAVFLNGLEIPKNGVVELSGPGPHLLTAERVGYQAFIKLIDLQTKTQQEVALVMKPALGAVLAQQILKKWLPNGGAQTADSAPLGHDLSLQFAKALGITHVIEANSSDANHVELKLSHSSTGEVLRSVRGRRMEWEPWPYAVSTEALAGRTLERPDLDALILALSAPTRVNAKEEIELVVQIRDSASQLRSLEVQCGEEKRKQKIAGIKEGALSLSLDAPSERTNVQCRVFGLSSAGEKLVQAPPEENPLTVVIDDPLSKPWYGRWYVWTAVVTAVAAGGAGAAYFSARGEPPEEHRLVFGIQ